MADQHAMFQQAVQFKRDFITNITGTWLVKFEISCTVITFGVIRKRLTVSLLTIPRNTKQYRQLH